MKTTHGAGRIAECVRSAVAVGCGVGRCADAYTVQDDENDFTRRAQLCVDFLFVTLADLNQRTIETVRSNIRLDGVDECRWNFQRSTLWTLRPFFCACFFKLLSKILLLCHCLLKMKLMIVI
jgi:hypothetical protein